MISAAVNLMKTSNLNSINFGKRISKDASRLKEFQSFLKDNEIMINAKLYPEGKTYRAEIELGKGYGQYNSAITDKQGYAIKGAGLTLSDAVKDMIKNYSGKEMYSKTGSIYEGVFPKIYK